MIPLLWRNNEPDGVSNHQPCHCLLNRLFRRRWKKTSKLPVTGLCEGNSPVTSEFRAQRASNAENVSIWWRHRDCANPGVVMTLLWFGPTLQIYIFVSKWVLYYYYQCIRYNLLEPQKPIWWSIFKQRIYEPCCKCEIAWQGVAIQNVMSQ